MSNLIKHPSVVLITGKRRSGKSCLGYHLLEKLHNERDIPAYVVSLPKEKHYLLPNFITPVDTIEELPENCATLVDEGSIRHHAHLWRQKETVVMDRMLSISGQRKQTFIFISHTMRKFAVTLLLEIDTLLCKEPSLFHSKLERSEVRKLVEEVTREFKKLPKDQIKKSVYIISEDYVGFIRNPMPSFFTPELSEAFAGISINGADLSKSYAGIPINKKEETSEVVQPHTIDTGLKLWFLPQDKKQVLQILSKNSTIDGELSALGVVCTAGKCHYDFDLKLIGDKYRVTGKVNIKDSIQNLEQKEIKIFVDVKSAFPLEIDDVDFKPYVREKQNKKNDLEKYAAEKVEFSKLEHEYNTNVEVKRVGG